jgi:hypothetical protein
MKKEDVNLVAQLLTGIRDALHELEKAQRKKNIAGINSAKKEILNFQRQINKIL